MYLPLGCIIFIIRMIVSVIAIYLYQSSIKGEAVFLHAANIFVRLE
jgi:hypothetical protein